MDSVKTGPLGDEGPIIARGLSVKERLARLEEVVDLTAKVALDLAKGSEEMASIVDALAKIVEGINLRG